MTKPYFPQYPILRREDITKDIDVNPEKEMDEFSIVELRRLREGEITYKAFHADTPQNREAVNIRMMYFQMVAFSESWKFDPQKYRVHFLPEGHPLLEKNKGAKMVRAYEFEEDSSLAGRLSDENGLGFRIYEEDAVRMENDETDYLIREVRSFDPF